jgi:DNA polymerase-3 subunit beta
MEHMKATISKHDLSNALATVQAAIPSRPTHPVLANVRLVANEDDQQVELIGFDLSTGIKTTFDAIVTEDGDVAIPFRLLANIVSKLPEGSISLECPTDGTLTTLTSLTGAYELRGMSVEEYPALPEFDATFSVDLTVDQLKTGLSGSLYAAATDLTKQVLCGVHLTLTQDSLEFAATDGHRLAFVKLDDMSDVSDKLELTVPANVLAQVIQRIGKLDDEDIVKLQGTGDQVQFNLEDTEIKARLLEDSYPNYQQLVPTSYKNSVVIDRKSLIAALERVAVIAERKNNIIKFDFQHNKLTLQVDATDVGTGQESLVTQSQGEGIVIAFNVRYSLDALRHTPSNEVVFEMGTPTSPVLVKPLGGAKVTHLVMPVLIRD